MRYEDYDGYDYDYDDLLENTDLYEINDEPWMDSIEEDDEVPSYGKNYYPDISEEDED